MTHPTDGVDGVNGIVRVDGAAGVDGVAGVIYGENEYGLATNSPLSSNCQREEIADASQPTTQHPMKTAGRQG